MKKMMILGLLLAVSSGFAQIRSKKDMELVPTLGMASSNYYSNKKLSNDPISSVNVGIVGDYFFSNRWSLHSGILFHTMGSEYVISGQRAKEKLNYITIPVNANWHFGSTRKWYLNFGPSFGFLTSATANGTDIKDLTEPFQVGLNAGIGYKIEVSKMFSISIDYQSMVGMTEIAKNSNVSLMNTHDSFNVGGVIKL